jgi:hypothetical protein
MTTKELKHKLIAILSADGEGYRRFMGQLIKKLKTMSSGELHSSLDNFERRR